MINLDNKKSNETHWDSLFIDRNTAVYFDFFRIEYWIDSYISHDEIVSVNNLLREYSEIKEEIKNSETSVKYVT